MTQALMKSIPLDGWLTDQEACARLGVSPRSLHRLVERHQLHPQFRPRSGNRPQRLFDPEEIQGHLPAPPTRVMPPVSPTVSPVLPTVQPVMPTMAAPAGALFSALERFANVLADRLGPPAPQALFLTLEQASEQIGLSVRLLKLLCAKGKIPAIRDNRQWRVKRSDVEGIDTAKLQTATEELRQVVQSRRATA